MKKIFEMALKVLVSASLLLAAVTLGHWSTASGATYNWLQYNGDPQHSGVNASETIISTANVASLARKFQITLPDTADGAPVYLSGVTTSTGVRNLLFLETKAGWILAVDA